MRLAAAQKDRVCGVMVATAAGDALGAGYEFGPALPPRASVGMIGGGAFGWAPGEWTDDTSMAIPILDAAAAGGDLREGATQDGIARVWYAWSRDAKDVGAQTSAVLGRAGDAGAAALRSASEVHQQTHGRSGGNGSLMRTAPVALAFLDDPTGLTEAAAALSRLTHWDPDAADACVLWCHLIRHAVLTGEIARDAGLAALTGPARERWAGLLDAATGADPRTFVKNGWVVQALQAAWAALTSVAVPVDDPAEGAFAADHLRRALEEAVRGGRDTDTVAAIAGGLLGARWGASAVPFAWQRLLHGWPGRTSADLAAGALRAAGAAPVSDRDPDYAGFDATPQVVAHPTDDGVLLGNIAGLRSRPRVDAVVSLCRVARVDAPDVPPGDWHQAWLIDHADPAANPNLLFVLDDAAGAVTALRAEGKRVFLHCAEARSRTPAVAALYAARQAGIPAEEAITRVAAVLPLADPPGFLTDAVRRLADID